MFIYSCVNSPFSKTLQHDGIYQIFLHFILCQNILSLCCGSQCSGVHCSDNGGNEVKIILWHICLLLFVCLCLVSTPVKQILDILLSLL